MIHTTTRSSRTARVGRRSIVAAALAATLLVTGCAPASDQSGSEGAGEPQPGGTLIYARPAAVNNLDLNLQITSNNAFAIDKIFEPLVSFDENAETVPWLAESWEVDEKGLVYTFTLREGVQFSDGTELTPNDVVFSLNRHREVGGPLPLTAPITSIEATGDREVTITLSQAYTPFLSELSGFSNGIFPANFGGLTEEAFFQAPIGTGPFVVSEWDPNGDLTFVKNEYYWQEGKPYLDSLVYRFIADDTQQKQQLIAGQVDAVETVPASGVAEIDASGDARVDQTGSWAVEQVFFNTLNEHFADPHVRRAIAHVLDREGITAATTFGTAEVANALIPPTIRYSANDAGIDLGFDLEAARDELAQSAYPDGFTATLLLASGNAQRAQIAQVVQEAAAQIGITLEIESIDLAAFRERFRAFDYDLMLNSGQSDAPDANGLITFQADPEGFSNSYWTHYTNERVTELMHEGRVTPDGDEREAIYLEIQEILANDAPYIPLFYPKNLKGVASKVEGFTVLPNGSVRFQDAWIAK